MTLQTGTDIVAVARVQQLIDGKGSGFLERWFTEDEIAYCSSKSQPALHFAGRLAAKEAVVKALHTDGEGPVPYRSVEIQRDATGVPRVRLSGSLLDHATGQGLSEISISLSHCQEYATAVAVADRPR